jgi:aerobic carbon-monoxide dehydrogenase medium subunit
LVLYSRPATIDEALAVLTSDNGAKCLAGGATLVAKINAGLPRPTQLVSLQSIAELQGVSVDPDGAIRIAAMTPHAVVAADARLAGGLALVREAASQIAHPAIRNMATLGGSLADADPSADYPCALLAAGAEVELAGPRGRRLCSIDSFFLRRYISVLEFDEIIIAVRLPPSESVEASTYLKYSRVDGDYATVSVGIRVGWRNGTCTAIKIALGSCGPTPIRIPAAERALVGTRLDASALRGATEAYAAAAEPPSDFRGTADYRRMIIPGLIERAVRKSIQTLKG